MSEEFRKWLKQYCWPISVAINRQSPSEASELLTLAETKLPTEADQPLEWESYRVAYIWHQYTVNRAFNSNSQLPLILEDHLKQLQLASTTPCGMQESLKAELCMRADAEAWGYGMISKQEITALLEQIENGQTNVMIWHYLSPWALLHRDQEFAGHAVEVLVESKGIDLQDVAYRRAALLHALVNGKATTEMIHRYFEILSDKNTKLEFVRMIMHVAEELALIDDDLRQLITEFQSDQKSLDTESG